MMNTLKNRQKKNASKVDINNNNSTGKGDIDSLINESSDEMEPLPCCPSGEGIAQDKADIEVLESTLKSLSPKWKNWFVRGIFAVIMITGFSFIVLLGYISYYSLFIIFKLYILIYIIFYVGPLAITFLILAIQFKCFHEIITIGYVIYKSHSLPWFRSISWYFLFTSNYYLYGASLIEKFSLLVKSDDILMILVSHHRFISFSLYLAGFVCFVLSLKKTYYLKQFTLFGYTHLALMIIVTQSNLMIQNAFDGLIWFLLPVALIHCNDIMAYIFGFFFGKTQLIKLSPKKTWEGYIGGAISTILFGFIFSMLLCSYESMICPLEYDYKLQKVTSENCTILYIFKPVVYNTVIGEVIIHSFQLHALVFSIFASTIGPFGGFFASGFKRAFKIKDFGDSIPGHGGFMDRFDCQLIMASFVNVYFRSFIWTQSPNKLFNQLLAFGTDDQMEFLRLVRNHLKHS